MSRTIRTAGTLALTGIMYGGAWLLDRLLVWQLRRDTPAEARPCAELRHAEGLIGPEPRCAVWDCTNAPTATIHGWDVCTNHDPRAGADSLLPNGQSADVVKAR